MFTYFIEAIPTPRFLRMGSFRSLLTTDVLVLFSLINIQDMRGTISTKGLTVKTLVICTYHVTLYIFTTLRPPLVQKVKTLPSKICPFSLPMLLGTPYLLWSSVVILQYRSKRMYVLLCTSL